MRRCVVLAAGAAVLLAAPAPAGAVILPGNLLTNPGFEAGAGVTTTTDRVVPPGWSAPSPTPTAVAYGAPGGFPSTALAAGIGGGATFAAGGPASTSSTAYMGQTVDVTFANAEIGAGQAQATVTACLGGFADQSDYTLISLEAFNAGGNMLSQSLLQGPTAADRGAQTSLLPRGRTVNLPPATAKVAVRVGFIAPLGQYNDGYADNLGLVLSRSGSPVPAPDCSVPPPVATGLAPVSAPPGTRLPTISGPRKLALPKTAATVARLVDGRLVLPLRCATGDGRTCTGTLRLSSRGLPGSGGTSRTLGTKAFAVADGSTSRIAVLPARAIRRRLAGLTPTEVRALRIRAVVATKSGATTRMHAIGLRRGG